MSSSPQLPPIDAARVLHQALAELDGLKRQIKQPFMAKSTVEASIARLEAGLQAKTQGLLAASLMETAVAMQQQQQQQQHQASPPGSVSVTFRPKSNMVRTLPPVQPSAAERVALFKADFVSKPQTDAARQYLQERFGIEASTSASGAASERSASNTRAGGYGLGGPGGGGAVARGTTAPCLILPKSIRTDPYAVVPPELTDLELSKGLMHLVNRGMLHIKADLTPALCGGGGSGAPVRAVGAQLHAHGSQFVRPPPTTALEDSMLAASANTFKLDLLTPVVPPQAAAPQPLTLRPVTIGGGAAAPADDGTSASQEQQQQQQQQQQGQPATGPPADPRSFDALMDTFSLHEFMIRLGKAITSTPEFESYRRTYEAIWDVVALLISQLEALMARYAVPLAIVDGKSLADLAQGVVHTEQQPQVQDLLLCLQNIQEVGSLLRQPGRRFMGPGGRGSAATKIQSAWRGLLARRRHSKAGVAAAAIQGAWRSHRLRTQLADRLLAARHERNAHFVSLQQRLYQQWEALQSNAHVVIHVPGMYRRQQMTLAQRDACMVAETAQLARLCDLAEPLVEVLLLLPGPPNPDVLSYWDKILQVGNVDDPPSRYRIIWPENHARLPAQMSITSKILSSPATMKRLRSAVTGRLAYVLPGIVGDEEVDLCVQLNVPLMGPSPSVATAMSCKSGARALLADAGVIVPAGLVLLPRHLARAEEVEAARMAALGPGREGGRVQPLRPDTDFSIGPDGEVTVIEPKTTTVVKRASPYEQDEARVLRCVSEAMVRSPWVNKWLLKVDDELMGCGHASVKVNAIKGAAAVLDRVAREHEQLTGEPMAPGSGDIAAAASSSHALQPLSEPQQVAVHRLAELLLRQMPRQLSVACREVYATYRDFVLAMAARGGVAEACPDQVVGSPCVNLFVTPTGETLLLSTHERIFVAPYRAVGTTFPQLSVPHRALAGASVSVGSACHRAGLIGHVCVDFVTVREASGPLRLWAVGLNPVITPSLMAFQLFDFLAAGAWDPNSGKYWVDPEPDELGSTAGAGEEARGDWDGVPDLAAGVAEAGARIQEQQQQQQQRQGVASTAGGSGKAAAGSDDAAAFAKRKKHRDNDALAGLHAGGWSDDERDVDVAQAMLGLGGDRGDDGDGHSSSGRPSSSGGGGHDDLGAEASSGPAAAALQQQLAELQPRRRQQQQRLQAAQSASQRFFFSLESVTHLGIAAAPCSKFFQRCYQEGLHFDVDLRTGIVLNLSDSYITGVMGLLTVGTSPTDIYEDMQRMLAFIAQRQHEAAEAAVGNPVAARQGSSTFLSSGGDLALYKDVQALVKYMADKSKEVARMMAARQAQQAHAQQRA